MWSQKSVHLESVYASVSAANIELVLCSVLVISYSQ
jgi:hypothetical protein